MKLLIILLILPAYLEANISPVMRAFIPRSYTGECWASGDPHYSTFDKKTFTYMGSCSFILATEYCPKNGNRGKAPRFQVVANTGSCDRNNNINAVATCVLSIDIIIEGDKIHLDYNTFSPAPKSTAAYSVTKQGSYVVVEARQFGLRVKWDRSYTVYVSVDDSFRGKICGMCGNFDGNQANDDSDGDKWSISGKCGNKGPQYPCHTNPARRAVAEKDCGVLKSDNFQSCRGHVDLDKLYDDCVYDVCANEASMKTESSCEAVKSASEECKEKAKKQVTWGHLEAKCNCQRKATDDEAHNGPKRCCHFPFFTRGVWFYDCAKQDAAGKLPKWCSYDRIAKPDGSNTGFCV